MTHLSLDAPLASLLDAVHAAGRKLSQRDLGDARVPPVAQATVANAIEAGKEIKLSTLDAYVRAAGYRLVPMIEPLNPASASGATNSFARGLTAE